jgi:hypothetical protein
MESSSRLHRRHNMPDRNVVNDSNPATQEQHQAKHGVMSTVTNFIGDHVALVIGVTIGVVLIGYVVLKRQGTSPAANVGTSATSAGCVDANGQAVDCSSSQAVGSLGNAGYQDSGVAYALTQLGQQMNNLQASLNAPPPTTTTTPNPTTSPVIPSGQWPTGAKWATGTHLTWNGQPWTVIVGSQGRIWGAPGTLSAKQALTVQNAPLLYQVPNWTAPTNAQATHSPIQSYLTMGRTADPNFDLSNPIVASRSGVQPSNHPGMALAMRRSQ